MRSGICRWRCRPSVAARAGSQRRSRAREVSGEKPVSVDVRVVVATHRDLEARVREDKFRQDLFHRAFMFFYRWCCHPCVNWRDGYSGTSEAFFGASERAEWVEDGSIFRTRRWQSCNHTSGRAMRELRNMVERLMLLHRRRMVKLISRHLEMALPKGGDISVAASAFSSGALGDRVDAFEREVILAD